MAAMKIRFTLTVVVFVATFVAISSGEDQPEKLTACQLKNDPAAYNHKLVEVTGFVSHDFEDFTIFDQPALRGLLSGLNMGQKQSLERCTAAA